MKAARVFGEALTMISRRSIAFVLKTVWGNPAHREALKRETQCANILYVS
jgi:hypothetical protein